ncbi:WD40 repeat domain-containing protein [Rhodovastum atsumiense]|uniref:WD40 repeat domain-containing protein n=1 Tax=Rhodovastum atsumiense TaxID=504468 RepID=A0A5M6IMH6_9PROT|nr:WD40 repeat domain-containing protein [Rhodovastum atsumiense]KAA5609157.1 WD40 repeat domain-containing protein [Rhodovastum atsumiense]CAH2601231.1 WD40 repeat domain-containing protein [Rhodovastum atsumiense]
MNQVLSADHLLETRGVSQQTDAFVVAVAFERAGPDCAFALGDGTLRIVARAGGDWRGVEVHDGAVQALAADAAPTGFLSGGDDGRLCRVAGEDVTEIAGFGMMKWVEHVTSFSDGKAALRACAVGKVLHLFDGQGRRLKALEHPSSVTGIVFDAKGKRIAASHYNGASLWYVASKTDNPRKLEWKGSHTGIAISPDGEAVVTAMQENALHGWRLTDGQHMRMTGYPNKTRALSFTRNGKWLATSGAESIVLWPFFGGGPMGKAPTELAGGDDITCTMVACHPQHEAVAAGFSDGLVVLADINAARILPVCGPGRGPVSALAWSAEGSHLAFGTETGFAAVVDFSKR